MIVQGRFCGAPARIDPYAARRAHVRLPARADSRGGAGVARRPHVDASGVRWAERARGPRVARRVARSSATAAACSPGGRWSRRCRGTSGRSWTGWAGRTHSTATGRAVASS